MIESEPLPDPAHEADELDARLAALPLRDVDELRAVRFGALARDEFLREHERATQSWIDRLGLLYHRALEPALVAAFCVAYLGWAFNAVLLVYR